MCTMATIWAHIGRIVYGAGAGDVHRMYFEDRHLDTMDFIVDAYRRTSTVVGGFEAAAAPNFTTGPGTQPSQEEQGNL